MYVNLREKVSYLIFYGSFYSVRTTCFSEKHNWNGNITFVSVIMLTILLVPPDNKIYYTSDS